MEEQNVRSEVPEPTQRRARKSMLLPLLMLGAFLFLIIALVGFGFVAFFSIGKGPSPVKVSNNSVVELDLQGQISEYVPPSGLELLFNQNTLYFHDYLDLLDKAQEDRHVQGLLLKLGPLSMGWAQAQELRDRIDAFRASGKWVLAYGEIWSEQEYYLASVADQVVLPPESFVFLDGLMARMSFYGELLDWAGIDVDVAAYGEYKNYADPYRYSEMTPENREAMEALLEGMNDELCSAVSESRGLSLQAVKASLSMPIASPTVAVEQGFFDRTAYFDQLEGEMRDRLKLEADDELRLIKDKRYFVPQRRGFSGSNQVAVIFAVGAIQSGDVERGSFGDALISSDVMIEQLRKAREDDRVKAIVLRIDSPGGSALASDVIWREIKLTSQAGKPVIASMGTVAASGGYYMAMACDEIVAEPATITGSIGVVSMRVGMAELYEKLMVNVEVIKTAPFADFYDPYRDLTQQERDTFQQRTQAFYRAFVTKAAQSRDMDYDALEPVARGRVWLGRDALEHGLVDQLGGLQDAIETAADRAGLGSSYKKRLFPEQKEFWDMFREQGLAETRTQVASAQQLRALRAIVPHRLRILLDLQSNVSGTPVSYAILPYVIELE